LDDKSTDNIQVALSVASADSLMMVLHNSGKLSYYLDSDQLPELTTTLLDGLLPGLVDKYGKD